MADKDGRIIGNRYVEGQEGPDPATRRHPNRPERPINRPNIGPGNTRRQQLIDRVKRRREQVVVPESEKVIGPAVASTLKPSEYSRRLDEVMVRATEQAIKQGITDPDQLREFKLKAREAFKKQNRL